MSNQEQWDDVEGGNWISFKEFGDSATGKFLKIEDKPNKKFGGMKPVADFLSEDGTPFSVSPPGDLANKLRAVAPGTLVRMTYVRSEPSDKGQPAKIFKVQTRR